MFRALSLVALVFLVPLVALTPGAAACSGHTCPPRPEYYATGLSLVATGAVGSTFVCLSDDCATDSGPGLGGGYAVAGQPYHNVLGSAQDDLYGSNHALWLCGGSGDGVCVATTEIGCGTTAIIGSEESFDVVIGHVLVLHVGPDLEQCGGSHGTFYPTFW